MRGRLFKTMEHIQYGCLRVLRCYGMVSVEADTQYSESVWLHA